MASIHARATLLKWNLRMKAKRDGAGPSRCQWMLPHGLLLRRGRGRRSAGWRRSAGGWWSTWRRVATLRRAISAFAHAHGRHLLPLLKLLRRKDGFHLRGRIVMNGFHLGPAVFRREAGLLSQVAHFLPLRVHDGLHFRFLVVGQVELVKVGAPPHARRTLAGWRSACGRSGRRRVGVTRAQGRTPHQQTACGQCRD